MWLHKSLKFFVIITGVAVAATAHADPTCTAPIRELQNSIQGAEEKLAAITQSANAARAKTNALHQDMQSAITRIDDARRQNNEGALKSAMAALSHAKKEHDVLLASESSLIIARIETERILRGARQALKDAAIHYREQGEALIRASQRASLGELTPSLTDVLVCQDDECGRLSSREHAAMIVIGAIAETLDPQPWPLPDRACDITILDPAAALDAQMRQMRAMLAASKSRLQMHQAQARKFRQAALDAQAAWTAEIENVLNAYSTPAANSHAEELLDMAIADTITKGQRLNTQNAAQHSTDAAYYSAQTETEAVALRIQNHIDYWLDIGQAVVAAANAMDRGNDMRPENSTVEAALAVMGSRDPDSDARCWLTPASHDPTRWIFVLSPPEKC